MPRKNATRLNVDLSEDEMKILEAYCQQTERSKTELTREWVRSLEGLLTPKSKQLLEIVRKSITVD